MKYFFSFSGLLMFSSILFSQNTTEPDILTGDKQQLFDVEAESNLPLILINTNNQTISDDPRIVANMKVINNADSINNTTDTDYEYNGKISIEIRGSSSQMFEKKNYAVETIFDADSNINISLLGMPKDNDWVLHGPYSDKSLMRNVLAYHFGNSTGQWAPRTRFCELYINNEYRGVYVLIEKIKRDNNRVDISKLNPDEITGDDLTGGYILKVDRPDNGAWISPYKGLNTWGDIYISYVEPKYENMPVEQREYIKNYITDFEDALYGSNFKDPVTGYRAYIDVRSFVDHYLINELSKNVDGYRLSAFFYKDKDSKGGKLTMGPLWDFNLGFGNADYYDCGFTEGWISDGVSSGDGFQIPFWWERFREDPYFEAQLKLRWIELRANSFSNANIENFIDSCADLLNGAQQRNFQKFTILDEYVWPNAYIGNTYANEINYLKDWFTYRLAWMDYEIDFINPLNEPSVEISANIHSDIFPNPFVESATLTIKVEQNTSITLHIRNILGQEIYAGQLNCLSGKNEFLLNESIFNTGSGIYFYELKTEDHIVSSGKLIKK